MHDGRQSFAADGAEGGAAAEDFGSEVEIDGVDEAFGEEAAKEFGAAFNEGVGPTAAAQFGGEGSE